MENLEQYLDRVCRGIGGPRTMRQHVRLELREHLLEAIAEHEAAGVSADEALARALTDFGGPDQVGSEFEAVHGHRLTTMLIDKAIEWKEKTMKAKWLWASWAYLALGGVILAEVTFLTWAMTMVMPVYMKMKQEGWLEGSPDLQVVWWWADGVLYEMVQIAQIVSDYWWLWIVLLAGMGGLFEWRVRSENKSLMRLAALATAALTGVFAVALMAAALIIQLTVAVPAMSGRIPERDVRKQLGEVEARLLDLRQAIAEKNWDAMRGRLDRIDHSMGKLAHTGATAAALLLLDEQAKVEQLRGQLKAAEESIRDAKNALDQRDLTEIRAAMQKFQEEYERVKGVAKVGGKNSTAQGAADADADEAK